MPAPGILYCIPTPLGGPGGATEILPAATLRIVRTLDYFIAENARTARAFLKQLPLERALQAIEIRELNEHSVAADLPALIEPLLQGRNAGLVSEAGCPAVADPGSDLVALAHRSGVRVVPMVGPSSMLLALMASGLYGQQFAFVGYLPVERNERDQRLRELERRSAQFAETILMIETPYRVVALFDAALRALQPQTMLSVACNLTLAAESVQTRSIAEWRNAPGPADKVPAVFALQAHGAAPGRDRHTARGPRPRPAR